MAQNRVAQTSDEGDKSRGRVRRPLWRDFQHCGRRARALFSSCIAASLIACSTAATAQEKPIEIGVLALGPRFVPAWTCGQSDRLPGSEEPRHDTMPFYVLGMIDRLKELKYIEDRPENAGKPGRRFRVDLRTGTPDQLRAAAREFAAKRVDVIVAVATAATSIAQEETRGSPIPILMTGVSDPVRYGFVQSLARPGGLITGVSHQVVQGSAKRVELLKEMLPGVKSLITLRRVGYVPSEKSMEEVRAAAERLKIEIIDWTVKNRAEVQAAMAKVRHGTADSMMVLPDSLVIANLDLVVETSLAQQIPLMGMMDYQAAWGAIASIGPSAYRAGERVASYVDKISNGAKPGGLPIEPIDPEVIVNLKAAKCYGVSVPLEVLSQADRVIR